MSISSRIRSFLTQEYSIYSLVLFRISFGMIMMWEVWRYFNYEWVRRYYIEPPFHFHYGWFEWIEPWPGSGMYIHFVLLGVLALFITIGFLYRISSFLFFLGFSYVFLLEQARYLNHFYLVVLLSFILIFLPLNRYLSIDAMIWPKIKKKIVSSWTVNMLRFQVGVAYFYGGVAKLNNDWLTGRPMDAWLSSRTDFPLIGQWFTERWMIFAMSYGGLLLDLLAVPLLLWRKSRLWAFIAIFLFHSMNDRLFSIGIFPWFMILATTIFLPTDWPAKMLQYMRSSDHSMIKFLGSALFFSFIASYFHDSSELMPMVAGFTGGLVIMYLWKARKTHDTRPQREGTISPYLRWGILVWVMVQLLIPLRHLIIPGNVNWTEEGHRFSWHMKLRDKGGSCYFQFIEPEAGGLITIDPRDYLTSWQYRKMVTRPYLILQFADHLEDLLFELNNKRYEIRVVSSISLNGRKPVQMIDPKAKINGQKYSDWRRNNWILLDH